MRRCARLSSETASRGIGDETAGRCRSSRRIMSHRAHRVPFSDSFVHNRCTPDVRSGPRPHGPGQTVDTYLCPGGGARDAEELAGIDQRSPRERQIVDVRESSRTRAPSQGHLHPRRRRRPRTHRRRSARTSSSCSTRQDTKKAANDSTRSAGRSARPAEAWPHPPRLIDAAARSRQAAASATGSSNARPARTSSTRAKTANG